MSFSSLKYFQIHQVKGDKLCRAYDRNGREEKSVEGSGGKS
jgi:hypothetical protein